MSIIDQSEIDELLAEADGLVAETTDQVQATAVAPPPPPSTRPLQIRDPSLKRLLRIRVPVIVQLAERSMSVAIVRDLSVGAIIEFDKNVEEQLDLRINNRKVGRGTCVKVGENFGLRISQICDRTQRIRSLGGDED